MYLKSVTLKGFKSFPDRTRLEFGPGVSVIVGPNGSGKSNITDAVLWALGEQSPGAVRGQSMQDVIFGGAPGRQAARAAEVELVLDDSDGLLGLGAPELSIVRRLDRAGEGEYRMAGARCRLGDVIELLSDTGLGKEMHSVISQGRIEAIVTSKPRDRRLLIEEAAGLGKHRKRRRRAQLKLERTQDNLDRALDVEREARLRLRPLKRQAEAAELHARLERQSLEARWELARDDVRARAEELGAAQAETARAREQRTGVEGELAEVGRRREAAEEALAARSALREELSRRLYAARSAAERIGYRAEAVQAAAANLDGRAQRTAERLAGLRAAHDAQPPDPAARDRIARLQTELDALERDRDAELSRQLAELERRREELAGALESLAARVAEARQARDAGEGVLDAARGAVRDAERGVEAARREAAGIGAELAGVNQFLRSQRSAPEGATSLADELEVAPGYELALAAALDGRLGAAVVAARDAAAGLLDRAGADGGRTLVFSPDAASPAPDLQARPPLADAEPLGAHVRGAPGPLALVRLLLRDTWVVESLEGLPSDFGGTAVTRGGRVWAADARELRQAPAVGEERVLSERNRREALIAQSEAAAGAERAARAALEAALAEVARLDGEREQVIAAHRAAVRERDEAAEEERRLAAAVERRRRAPDEGPGAERRAQLRAEISAEAATLARAEREQAEREATIARLGALLTRDRALAPQLATVHAAILAAGEAVEAQREQFEAALAGDRAAGEQVAGELRACAQQEAALQTRLHAANERLTGLEVRASRAEDHAAEARRELAELAGRLELEAQPADAPLPEDEREVLRARLERLTRRREQLGPVNPLAQEEYAEALAHVEELERQRGDLETALRELEQLIKDTDREIRETFERTFAAAAANFEDLSARLFPGGHGRLRLVTERDGPARVLGGQAAPEEREGEGRDSEGELDDDGAEDEDRFGVEIEITPAGKAMKRLSLLSGGEKSMTALAFLFAVFLAKPCPFYILDEVEAALDDLNIDRFLDLLGAYAERAQFIVVTHQKRTMEAADSLYGVSMGGDGISKVISRRMPPREGPASPSSEEGDSADVAA